MKGLLPSLAALKLNDLAATGGTGKRKVDGDYADTRLGKPVSVSWANERFRQVMVLVREFRIEWPNQSLLTSEDVEFIRVAVDVALASAAADEHVGDIYDLNPTTWSIWLVQHAKAVRRGAWVVESEVVQERLSFESLYRWLEVRHERGDRWNVYDPSTRQLLHRYKLPFKAMRIPPKKEELFKWRKGGKRLSDWMVDGGLAPLDPAIQNLLPPALVTAPPLQSQREQARQAMWSRVASRARTRRLWSVGGDGGDDQLTRTVVGAVMDESRTNGMSEEEADTFTRELEEELEQQQQQQQPTPTPQLEQQGLSEYEQQRLRNIARNQELLRMLGLADGGDSLLQCNRQAARASRDPYPPGRSGDAPTRRSQREKGGTPPSYDDPGSDVPSDSEDGALEGTSSFVSSNISAPPPPGAVIIDLVSDDEEAAPAPAPPAPPTFLPPDLTRREGLFIAPSTVPIESGPSAGLTLKEPGLFTSVAIPAGAFVCIYTGSFFLTEEFEGLPRTQRDQLSRYATEVAQHDVTIAPPVDATTGKVDFLLHPAAAANEPNASGEANAFTQASVVEIVGSDGELHAYLVACIFTCRAVAAGGEVLWNYGDGYEAQRRDAGYDAGSACPDELIDERRLPSMRRRVEAILREGQRDSDAVYEIALSATAESSGDEWAPVSRCRRRDDSEAESARDRVSKRRGRS